MPSYVKMDNGSLGDFAQDLGFVQASGHRTAVLFCLRDWPRTTGQVALSCGLSPPHASRAIKEMLDRGLVDCATPTVRGRGRQYALTDPGRAVTDSLTMEARRPLTVPLARVSQPRGWYLAMAQRFGTERAREVMEAVGLSSVIDKGGPQWIPVRQLLLMLDETERRFGDGSYRVIRQLASDAVYHYPAVRRYITRAIPNRFLIDLAPAAYLREFNHGRLEVEGGAGRVHFKLYEWASSPARCAGWLGSWEGLFKLRKLSARIEKQQCVLQGDEFCGYYAEWDE